MMILMIMEIVIVVSVTIKEICVFIIRWDSMLCLSRLVFSGCFLDRGGRRCDLRF